MTRPFHIVLSVFIGAVAGILLALLITPSRITGKGEIVIDRDSTVVVDTNIYIAPPAIDIEVNISDSIIVEASDIIITEDSLVVLPMQTKTYEDSDYRCQVSGYKPNLDWIEVYPKTVTVKEKISVSDVRRHSVEFTPLVIVGKKVQMPVMAGYRYTGDIFQFHVSAGYDILMDSPIAAAGVTIPIKRW